MSPAPFIGGGFMLLLVILAARNMLSTTKWWLCPRCLHWHNQIGETMDRAPYTGIVASPVHKYCPQCCRRYNDSL